MLPCRTAIHSIVPIPVHNTISAKSELSYISFTSVFRYQAQGDRSIAVRANSVLLVSGSRVNSLKLLLTAAYNLCIIDGVSNHSLVASPPTGAYRMLSTSIGPSACCPKSFSSKLILLFTEGFSLLLALRHCMLEQ